MKIIANIFKTVIAFALAAVIITVGCFTAVFFMSADTPEEIYLFDYALVFDTDIDGKHTVWFVKDTDCASLDNGDGVVYYNGKYCQANAMVTDYGTAFYKLDDLTLKLAVSDDNIVGEILAVWQQK